MKTISKITSGLKINGRCEMKAIKINVKTVNLIKNALVYVLLAAQIGLIAFYLFAGVSNAFGMRINVFSAVTLCLSVANVATSSFYKFIAAPILGAYFFIFAFRMVVSLINNFQYLKMSLKNIEYNTKIVDAVYYIFSNFGKCLYFSIAFLLISRAASLYRAPSGVITIFIIAALLCIVARFIIGLIDGQDLINSLYKNVLCYGIPLVAIALFFANLSNVTVGTTFNIFRSAMALIGNLSDGVAWLAFLDQYGVSNICVLIIQVFGLGILVDLLTMRSYRSIDKYGVKKVFIFAIVIAAVHVALSAVSAVDMGFELIPVVFSALIKYLPATIFIGITYFSLSFPESIDFPEPSEKDDSEEKADGETASFESEKEEGAPSANASEASAAQEAPKAPEVEISF